MNTYSKYQCCGSGSVKNTGSGSFINKKTPVILIFSSIKLSKIQFSQSNFFIPDFKCHKIVRFCTKCHKKLSYFAKDKNIPK